VTNGTDDDLAPVTNLFGAWSRRRNADRDTGVVSDAGGDARDNAGADANAGVDTNLGANAGVDANSGVAATAGPGAVGGDGPESDDQADAAAVVPLPFRAGSGQGQAEWLSPVVGDGSGRSARAEQDGYDDATADARTASVFSIANGDELDPDDVPRPVDEQRADAERISMKALGRKGISESEMRTTLARHELDVDVIEHEIDRLTRVGLLDDVALATDLVDRLHDRKGLGRQGVVTELRRRGIPPEVIDRALDEAADDDDDEFVRAIELAEKRAGQLRGLDQATAERRLSGFLMRKGYNSGVVRIAVERALSGSGRGGSRGPGGGRGTVRFE
jgi:regulatory protein